jgi:hypothetical protein
MLSLLPLVLLALIAGVGYGELLPARVRKTLPLVEQVVFGLALLGTLATLCQLILPLGGALRLGLLAAGVASALTHRRTLARRTRGRRLAILAACLLTLPAYLDVYQFDVGLYHAQAIRWLREERLVLGLGYLSWPLAQYSSWHVLGALLGTDETGALGYAALLPVPFVLLGVRIAEATRHVVARSSSAGPSDLFLCFAGYVLLGGLLRGFAAAPTDLAVAVLLVLATAALLERRRAAATCLAAFASSIKLTAAPFLLGCVVMLTIAAIRARRQQRSLRVSLGPALALAGTLVLPGLVVQALRSGCAFFPLAASCGSPAAAAIARSAWSRLSGMIAHPLAGGLRTTIQHIAGNLDPYGHVHWVAFLGVTMPFVISLGGLMRPHTTYAAALVARRAILPIVLGFVGVVGIADARFWLGGLLGMGLLLVTIAALAWGLPLCRRSVRLGVLVVYAALGCWRAPSGLGRSATPPIDLLRRPPIAMPQPMGHERHGELEVVLAPGSCWWLKPPCRPDYALLDGDGGFEGHRRAGWWLIAPR